MISSAILAYLSILSFAVADDILGCNGFIKSDVPINYSSVEIRLLTKQGVLKDQTDCAPNNGYYFLPMYDKGEYILKVAPPQGWKFEPSEVPLIFDGTTDLCSKGKDINFNFLGFAIDGQVKGFTVTGRVLWSPNGKPMNGATIYLNGNVVGKTDADGVYTLESMQAGTYLVKVEAENVVFKESEVKISSTTLPDLVPFSYKVCGHFQSPTSSGPYKVELTSADSTSTEVTTDSKGSYCLFLTPGKYTFTPVPDKGGLLFSPAKRTVNVVDGPIRNVDFSQLRSTIKGKIVCMTQCPLIAVNLKPRGQGSALQTIAKNGRYEFGDVMPGDYDIYLEPGLGWCWDKESLSLIVVDEITEVPTFTQSGYTVTIVSSHSTGLTYYSEGLPNEKLKLNVSPGSTHICVSKSTPYIFKPEGCHRYEDETFRWVTGSSVVLKAVSHANSYSLVSSEEIADLTLTATPIGADEAQPTIVAAEKEGYVLTGLAKLGEFSAHKLAEIIVSVSDMASKEKLQGVLLSLSGGKNYRRNAQTNADGTMSFLSLSPGEYFLKPMMKEYRFHPQNKIIKVQEGATVPVTLNGERVAYSCIGQVASLNGEGEGSVVVEAAGIGDCSNLLEDATSNESGSFRIRGLKPGVGKGDVSGLKMYALRPSSRVDVLVYVVADRAEDLKTLRLRLIREDEPDTAVSIIKLSEYKPSSSGYALTSVMIALPPIQADGRSYVLQLESSLPLGTHEYINRPVHFKASGSHKVFRMTFSPNLKSRDPELSQSSYIVLPLLILLGITFYNKDAVVQLTLSALERSRQQTATVKASANDDLLVTDPFADYPKKKSKFRKT
ncbi:unnamed protein product [Nesidiocoris tenuis]|uniref:ER membrane protein complex subunit 7 beta-sandwich domain-containing protein n=1 Tax=Nesidiocoris tenuis TaxID=355587 RepID=A0A6H5GNI8_9HEMI|nr:unnamed protein product [Nesidiocoris tenuis]